MIRYLAAMIVALAGFSVLLDMIGVMIENLAITRVLTILEEAGEMVALSVITWFVFRLPDLPTG